MFLRHLFLSWLLTDITLPAANFIYLTLVSNYSISRATELPLKKNAVERQLQLHLHPVQPSSFGKRYLRL